MIAVTPLPARISRKIELTIDGCWQWTGAVTSRGYGSAAHEGRTWSTHRLAYELLVGPIPAGLQIDHLCRNRRCCNPEHLEPVTGRENVRRACEGQTHCAQGHPLAGRNLVIRIRYGNERRLCRLCHIEWERQRYRKHHPNARSRSVSAKRAEILADAERTLAELKSRSHEPRSMS